MTDTAIEAASLGKRFGRRRRFRGGNADGDSGWALRDCTFRLPAGHVCAVVGPNGAGKSTLLAHAAGLLRPTEGTLTVLGTTPAAARARVAYVAQDKPLYPQLTIADTLRMGRELNTSRWDAAVAERVVRDGDLDPQARVRSLSGGQRTRVALALALGKRPELLLLDEPMADLDPLARHQLMGTLLSEAAEHGTTVVMSSHIIGELADACDWLLLVGRMAVPPARAESRTWGRIRLGGGIDDLVAAHTLVTGRGRAEDLAPHTIVEARAAGRGLTALLRPELPLGSLGAGWETAEPSLEDIVLAHLRSPDAPALLTPSATSHPAVAA